MVRNQHLNLDLILHDWDVCMVCSSVKEKFAKRSPPIGKLNFNVDGQLEASQG